MKLSLDHWSLGLNITLIVLLFLGLWSAKVFSQIWDESEAVASVLFCLMSAVAFGSALVLLIHNIRIVQP